MKDVHFYPYPELQALVVVPKVGQRSLRTLFLLREELPKDFAFPEAFETDYQLARGQRMRLRFMRIDVYNGNAIKSSQEAEYVLVEVRLELWRELAQRVSAWLSAVLLPKPSRRPS